MEAGKQTGAKIKHRLRRHAATRAQGALRGPARRLTGLRATVGGPCAASGKIPTQLALVVRELPRAQGAPARGLGAAAGWRLPLARHNAS